MTIAVHLESSKEKKKIVKYFDDRGIYQEFIISFQKRDTKLGIFLVKNQHTLQRKYCTFAENISA